MKHVITQKAENKYCNSQLQYLFSAEQFSA